MNWPCDCCIGPRVLTPLTTGNRAGLSRLSYRIGTHATFLATMQARLSSNDYPELTALKSRDPRDPAMALLDAWATVGDVLTFYQERIANEGYLRTATERRSVLELARLVGYALRPGVAASVYLAYALEKDADPVEIPAGARVNSVPAPGEQMQAFETAEPLTAHVEWNAIKPRLTQPQTAASIEKNGLYVKGTATDLQANDPLLIDLADGHGMAFRRIEAVESDSEKGTTRIVLRARYSVHAAVDAVRSVVARYAAVERFEVDPEAAMTKRVRRVLDDIERAADAGSDELARFVEREALPRLTSELRTAREGRFTRLEPWVAGLMRDLDATRGPLAAARSKAVNEALNAASMEKGEVGILRDVIEKLEIRPSIPPASARQLPRSISTAYAQRSDTIPRLLTALQPALVGTLYASWRNLPPPKKTRIEAQALRVAAAPFGHNAPLRQTSFDETNKRPVMDEWDIEDPWNTPPDIILRSGPRAAAAPTPAYHKPGELYLDNEYDIAPDSLVVIERPDNAVIIGLPERYTHGSLTAYGLSGKTVQVNLPAGKKWIKEAPDEPYSTVRNTRVYAGSEKLDLAEEPMTTDVAGSEIELGDLYASLEPGRWLIIAGERSDIKAGSTTIQGLKTAELVMIASVEQKLRQEEGVPLPGETVHTFITLAEPLAYRYRRDTVTIYGNVVKATHGETRQEVLGSGDASRPFQQYTLKQAPLTYVSAPTVSGVESSLIVRVNEVRWHEADGLAALGPNDRKFITRTDDDEKTSVIFGDGERGARLPTGQENVKATYRNGIGKPGNVKAGQITLLSTRPLGVKEVINPIRASGGADKESRDSARRNAPLALMALDRLVSTRDYADFARTFAGVGKASAVRLSDGRRQVVHITIAGADDIPIESTSDLYRNLFDALHRYGDPYLPLELAMRERLALIVSAKVSIEPDYDWNGVEPRIRAAVLDAFSFEALELGEDLLLSEAIAVIQSVRGVAYVDVDVFDAISEDALLGRLARPEVTALKLNDRVTIEPARVVIDLDAPSGRRIAAAQLAYLAPEVADTLILQELKS